MFHSFTEGNVGGTFEVEDYYVDLKHYKITDIALFQNVDHISGFEVYYQAVTGYDGYAPIRHLFGTRELITKYKSF